MIEINKIKPGTIIKATMTGQPNKLIVLKVYQHPQFYNDQHYLRFDYLNISKNKIIISASVLGFSCGEDIEEIYCRE